MNHYGSREYIDDVDEDNRNNILKGDGLLLWIH